MSDVIRQRSISLQQFSGGLNNYWDQSSIADNELAVLINMELSTTGALTSRPPIYTEKNGSTPIVTPVAGQAIDIIGTFTTNAGDRFLVVVTTAKTWLYNITTKVFSQIATFRASDCTQYDNKLALCSTTISGGYWDPITSTFTTVTTMPLLGGIEVFQGRMFGYGVQGTSTANTLYWSDITTFGPSGQLTSIWSWKDATGNYWYVEIGTGDGQWITAMEQGYNDVVLFRNRSTYRYSYGDDPAYGTMQAMQQDIGAESKRSVVKFENAHFVFSGGILYKYQNWLYYPLNAQKVKMETYGSFTSRFQHAVSIVGRRCFVYHNGASYSYNLDTDTWSEWETATNVAYFVEAPRKSEETEETKYYGISGNAAAVSGASDFALWRIENTAVSGNGSESFKCTIQTKIYDFGTPVEWKRLFFWGTDVQSANPVKAITYPVALPATQPVVTWDELSKDYPLETAYYTWDQMNTGNWDYIKAPSGGIVTITTLPSTGYPLRTELKLNQGLRFRRIYFELYLDCDGTAATSPVQLFSIIPMVSAKAKVVKGAN